MANQLWRHLIILLWLCGFLLATYGAPFGDETSSKRSTRTRRVIRKAGHRKGSTGRNLVRYRYPIYTKRSSVMDWNIDNGNEDFISFLTDQDNPDEIIHDLSQPAKSNTFDSIDEEDDRSDKFSGTNLKKTWSLIEKQRRDSADERHDLSEFDDNDAYDNNDVAENILREIDAFLSLRETQKGKGMESKKSPGWKKRSLPTPPMQRSINKASIPAIFHERGFHHDGIPIQSTGESVEYPWKTIDMAKNSMSSAYTGDSDTTIARRKRSTDTVTTPVEATLSPPSADDKTDTKHAAPLLEAHSGNIRKKSIDWDDYFGFDKRSGNIDDAALEDRMQSYLENGFYRPMGGAYRKKNPSTSGQFNKNETSLGTDVKKRRSFNGDWKSGEEEEEEEDSRLEEDLDGIDRRSTRHIANLMSQLKEEDLKKATSQMTQQLLDAIKEEIQDDIRRYKYASGPRHTKGIEYKRSLRKRNGLKSNFQKRENECAVMEQVVMTCDSLGYLMGGYRSILGDACYRQQACFICATKEDELESCNIDFQQYTSMLCDDDLVCRSQSRRLLSALSEIDIIEAQLFKGNEGQIQALCRHDECLSAFWKRR